MGTNKLIIVGTNPLAEIANEYFTYDSDYDVVAFSLERAFIKPGKYHTFLHKPLIAFEEIEDLCDTQKHSIFVALGYGHTNDDRTRLYLQAKVMGFNIASYVSSKAFVWRNVKIGEHCFIFEDNTIQPFVEIGNNVIMWSGNHIGQHTKIGDNNFLSSHVVVYGQCEIENNCFFGVNSTIANNLWIGNRCVIGAGANVVNDLQPDGVYVGNPAKRIKNVDEMEEIR